MLAHTEAKVLCTRKGDWENFSMASVTNVRKFETQAIIPLNETVVGRKLGNFIKVSMLYSYKIW